MSTVVELPAKRVPRDTFPVRLAIIRAEMGWNYDQAARATGINSETWRMWEKGKRHCTDIDAASRAISAATGFAYEWLMIGGQLSGEPPPTGPSAPGVNPNADIRRNNPCYSHGRVILGPWNAPGTRTTAA